MSEIESWQDKLIRSLDKTQNDPVSRFFQLATVDRDGRPHIRTVVMRNFDKINGCIEFNTDGRSEKCAHILANNSVSICWYFAHTREQYRIECIAKLINRTDDNDKVIARWHTLSADTQRQFSNPVPGTIYSASQRISGLNPAVPSANFVIVELQCQTIDYLNVGQSPHLRLHYTKFNCAEWRMTRLNP